MELLLELFMTAFVAICFSFIVAKLVSIAMVDDGIGVGARDLGFNSSKLVEDETVVEDLTFDRGLEVEGTQSKSRVQFVVEQVVEKVDQFGADGSLDNSKVLRCCEELVQKRCEEEEICGSSNRIEAEESSGRVSEVKSPELVSGFQSDEVNESTDGDEFCGVREGEIMNTAVDELIVDEKIENEQADDEMVEELGTVDVGANQSGDVDDRRSGVEGELNQIDEAKKGLVTDEDDDDDDWEGIERSELEKVFATAAHYVAVGGKDDRLSNLESGVQMQFYGLHKVAMEGPCHEAQPMALKVSARAKWNAWQRLGNITPEVAMEQYISLLSNKDPGWMQGGNSAGDGEADSSEAAKSGSPSCNTSTFVDTQRNYVTERKQELMPGTEGDLTGGSNSVKTHKA